MLQEKPRYEYTLSNTRLNLIQLHQCTTEQARQWRAGHRLEDDIEIRSSDIFIRSLELLEERPAIFWSFEENPVTLSQAELRPFWEGDAYMGTWRGMQI